MDKIQDSLKMIEQISGNKIIKNPPKFNLVSNAKEAELIIRKCILAANPNITEYKENQNYIKCIDYLLDTKGLGLALFGDYGTGKTDFIKVVINYLLFEKYKKILYFIDAKTLTNDMVNAILSQNTKILGLDDVGSESDIRITNRFIPLIIDFAYSNSSILFITSNKTRQQFIDLYGLPILDRIESMCKIVEFKGDSFRKLNKNL